MNDKIKILYVLWFFRNNIDKRIPDALCREYYRMTRGYMFVDFTDDLKIIAEQLKNNEQ